VVRTGYIGVEIDRPADYGSADAKTPVPWKETGPFEERRRFVIACRDSDESLSTIWEEFGISRQEGYRFGPGT
jgi:hypothetical protein